MSSNPKKHHLMSCSQQSLKLKLISNYLLQFFNTEKELTLYGHKKPIVLSTQNKSNSKYLYCKRYLKKARIIQTDEEKRAVAIKNLKNNFYQLIAQGNLSFI